MSMQLSSEQETATDQEIKSHLVGNVMVIELDRHGKKNALTLQMYRHLSALLIGAMSEPSIKVVTICGGEHCFSAGNDLNDFLSAGVMDDDHPVVQFLQVLAAFEKPIIAGVAGYAVGIGTTMLMHCDLVYAAPNAKFQLPFVQLGLCPEGASSLLLPNLVGYQKACELLFFGDFFDAAQAQQFGLVNQVVSDMAITDFIAHRAAQLAQLPETSIYATKRLLKQNHGEVVERMDHEIVAFSRLLHSDYCRGILAKLLAKSK